MAPPHPTTPFELKLIIIGCRGNDLFTKLESAVAGVQGDTSSVVSKLAVSPQRGLGQEDNALIGNRVIFERGMKERLVCSNLREIYSEKLGLTDDIDGYSVIDTAPFLKGYVDLKTEIVIILLPDTPHPVEAFVDDQALSILTKPPGADKDFICTVSVQILNDEVAFLSTALPDHTLIVSSTFAAKYNLGKDEFVRAKLQNNVEAKSRYMKISVIETADDSVPDVQLSPIACLNLGADPSTKNSHVTLERCQGTAMHISSHASFPNHITVATHMKISKVRMSYSNLTQPHPDKALKRFLSTERYMRVNDMFVIELPDDADVNKHSLILMKVFEINKSSNTTPTYAVNTQECTLLCDTSKRAFVPAALAHCGVKVGKSLKSLRDSLLGLLAPFVKNKWSPNPLPFVILCGPEGSGKSVVARHIAKLIQCNYLEENCINLVADAVNSTEVRIANILHRSSATSPCVLLLRNIDMLTKEENANNVENPRVAQYFQTHLEKTMKGSDWPIIVFGTCEKLNTVSEAIREAALREVDMQSPNSKERLDMLEEFTEGLNLSLDISLQHFADHTAGFIYGDLKALVANAERSSITRAFAISSKQLGRVCERSIRDARILVNNFDFQQGLDKIQSVQSSDLGAPKIPNVKWSDIGGLQKVKEDILDTIQLPLRHPELFTSTMRRSGVLLYGPPGTGKTLLAKAVATECALNFFSVKGPELINMYVGQSEENIRQVFKKARSASPCVIFFDELDSLAPNRGRSGDSGGVMDRVVSQLLAELDGLVKSSDVFVIGATNRPDLLDQALLRPGRFDKMVYVGICATALERQTILEAITRKFELESDCDLEKISEQCPSNVTGADLYSLCAEAMTNAIKRQINKVEKEGARIEDCKLTVGFEDFKLAVDQITPSLSAHEIKRYEDVRQKFSMESEKEKPKLNTINEDISITDL